MNLNKEESADLVESFGNTLAEGALGFGGIYTGIIANSAPTPTAKGLIIAAGASSSIAVAGTF